MMKQRTGIFVTFGVAMACLVVAAIAMAWIKMDFAHCNEDGSGCKLGDGVTPAIVTGVFALFFVALVRKHQHMKRLFKIGTQNMVQGDVRLMAATTEVLGPATLTLTLTLTPTLTLTLTLTLTA